MASGTSITCEGWARFWRKTLNSDEQVTDSLRLEANQMREFGDLVNDPALFSYRSKFRGNYVTFLIIEKGRQFNELSFDESKPPDDMPPAMKRLISEIKTVRKQ